MESIYKKLIDEFYIKVDGVFKIDNFYIYKTNDVFGVGILNVYEKIVNESLASVQIKSVNFTTEDQELNLIVLTSNLKTHIREFASFCMHFIDKGINNDNRELIQRDPYLWWKKWKELIGNKIGEVNPYDIIAELLAFERISSKEKNTKWLGPKGSSFDIQTDENYYEIKSTIVRYENQISVSSQYQNSRYLKNKDGYLIFFKFEEMSGGQSINKILERLRNNKEINIDHIEEMLERKGIKKGQYVRSKTYQVLDVRKYKMDERFPVINNESFKGNKIHENIKKITYVLSLDGLDYKKLDW